MVFIKEVNEFARTLRTIDITGFFCTWLAIGLGVMLICYEEVRLGLITLAVGMLIGGVYRFAVGLGFTMLTIANRTASE